MRFSRIHLVHTGEATGDAHIRLITKGCNCPIRGWGRVSKAVYEAFGAGLLLFDVVGVRSGCCFSRFQLSHTRSRAGSKCW